MKKYIFLDFDGVISSKKLFHKRCQLSILDLEGFEWKSILG